MEVTYARQYLTLLDNRPTRLASDHVQDPKTLPVQPAYCLPRAVKTFVKNAPAQQPQIDSVLKLSFKALKASSDVPNPVSLSVVDAATTSIFDLKYQLGAKTGYAPSKIKILWQKKPVIDSKTVQEVLGRSTSSAEFGVMFVGQPEAKADSAEFPMGSEAATVEATRAKANEREDGWATIRSEAFWNDLRGFVLQRTKDEDVTHQFISKASAAFKQ